MSQLRNGKRKIRYAVVGLGWISQDALLPGFQNATGNSELVALVSGDPKKLKSLGRRYGIHRLYSYDDYDACLTSGEVDAVYIGLPNHLHADYTIRAAKHGVHVLCEKPMAVTEQECRRMMRAAEDNKIKLMIAYRLHLEPANLDAIKLVADGKIGEPRFYVSTHTGNIEPGNVRLMPVEQGGGPVYDIGVYCINAARYLFRAEPTEVFAVATNGTAARFRQSTETVSVVMTFPGERIASFTCSFGTASISSYSIVGTKGALTLDPAFGFQEGLRHELVVGDKMREREYAAGDQFGTQLKYFSDCILNDKRPEPSGQEGLNDVHIVRAIHKSAQTNRAVRLTQLEDKRKPDQRQKMRAPAAKKPDMVKAKPPK